MQTSADQMKLSIIVPCYKVEKYLPKCLASLMGQTLDNYEVICINDGSPDHCIDILHEWQAKYPDKLVIIDKKNEGVWRGRWDGIAKARGEYIGFLDSDDYCEPDFAELLYNAAKKEGADIAVCGFSRIDLETRKALSREMCTPRPDFVIDQDPGRLVELNGAQWNKVYRASLLKNLSDLPIVPPTFEDLLFNWICYAHAHGKVVFVPKSLVNYVVHEGSNINSIKMDQVQKTYAAFKQVKAYYTEAGASKELQEALDAAAFLHLGISLNYRLASDPKCDLKAAIANCTKFLNQNFPTWHDSPYIKGSYARTRGGAFKRLLTVSRLYKLGLLPAFLHVYSFVIKTFDVDIKW